MIVLERQSYISNLAVRLGFDSTAGLLMLDQLVDLAELSIAATIGGHEEAARVRIALRDPTDCQSSRLPFCSAAQSEPRTIISSGRSRNLDHPHSGVLSFAIDSVNALYVGLMVQAAISLSDGESSGGPSHKLA